MAQKILSKAVFRGPNAEINNWFVVVNKTKRKREQSERVKRVIGIVRQATRATDREGKGVPPPQHPDEVISIGRRRYPDERIFSPNTDVEHVS